MADNKKWRIKDLPADTAFCNAAKIVLEQRLSSLVLSIKAYFEQSSPENLHSVRIALRRMRYTMEIFYDCFAPKKFMAVYKNLEKLQDLTGMVRDLDVLKENVALFTAGSKIKIPKNFLIKIDAKKEDLTKTLKLELMKFYHSKRVKKFI
ncbi:MAG: CHAD domain-containing protein [Ignavibacteriaceae bacterium]